MLRLGGVDGGRRAGGVDGAPVGSGLSSSLSLPKFNCRRVDPMSLGRDVLPGESSTSCSGSSSCSGPDRVVPSTGENSERPLSLLENKGELVVLVLLLILLLVKDKDNARTSIG